MKMKEGDIVVINESPGSIIHARLKHPLVSGWVVEIICAKGVQHLIKSGHPAYTGYAIWTNSDKIGYEYEHSDKEMAPCDDKCVFEEEMELYKTYGGD
tara:strand:- start:1864 stop:2157 length:294 start_codon:yes stop_codon:yes gene_type:complete